KLASTSDQIAIINDQKKLMEIRSPQDGIVTTWEVKKNLLGRPVDVGAELIQVAAVEGDWVMEVDVPDDDMAPILDAKARLDREIKDGRKDPNAKLSAYFVTATNPEHRYEGYVQRVAAKAETVEGKHVVKVTVGFSDKVKQDYMTRNQVASLRPGSE